MLFVVYVKRNDSELEVVEAKGEWSVPTLEDRKRVDDRFLLDSLGLGKSKEIKAKNFRTDRNSTVIT